MLLEFKELQDLQAPQEFKVQLEQPVFLVPPEQQEQVQLDLLVQQELLVKQVPQVLLEFKELLAQLVRLELLEIMVRQDLQVRLVLPD